ncbi:hypothetical protein AB835_07360 [Candidatus Endobugula sertula]|uniref:OmpA-like domain-containing protein n=1 Tax=Candidatus Endobugula sertula TaxID=62101 RepID=A0A1D2QQ50_9GAMM|nr:hypothetical protein AB835_07360 [Candidatus Endobugula sertula]
MLRRPRTELAVHHERWLVSYADFMTLLFGFFVIMYAISNMHENKYQELSKTLTELFAASQQTIDKTVASQQNTEPVLPSQEIGNKEPVENNAPFLADIAQLTAQMKEKLADLVNEGSVTITSDEQWLQLSLNNKILFPLGSVQPTQQAGIIIEELASILKGVSNPVRVEGFTDNLSISTARFPSNWELSSVRAVAILRLLVANGVAPEHLSAVGHGEYQPIADNSTAVGRAQNRRILKRKVLHPLCWIMASCYSPMTPPYPGKRARF